MKCRKKKKKLKETNAGSIGWGHQKVVCPSTLPTVKDLRTKIENTNPSRV